MPRSEATPPAATSDPRSILVIRLSALGDVLHCLPAVELLRERWPDADIDFVTESLSAPLLEGHPSLTRVVTLRRKEWSRRVRRVTEWTSVWEAASAFRETLRQRRYDRVLDFQGNLRSRLVALASRRSPRSRFSHHRSEVKEHGWFFPAAGPETSAGHVHRVEKNLHLARSVTGLSTTPTARLPEFASEREELFAALGDDPRPRVLLQPFVSAFGRFKEWPRDRFAAVARRLLESGELRVLVGWGPGDREAAASIVAAAPGSELAPETGSVRHLAALMAQVSVVVGADTGPTHLAATLGIPVIGLYGPKDPTIYGPWSDRAAVLRSAAPCSPCRLRKCAHAICMPSIAVGDVEAAVLAAKSHANRS